MSASHPFPAVWQVGTGTRTGQAVNAPVADLGWKWHQPTMEGLTTFLMPLTAFQRAVLERLGSARLADLQETLAVTQHPYVHPRPGAANQYLTGESEGQLRLYAYDDEVGFDGFTLERCDFATDEAQIIAMIEEIEHLRTKGS